MFLVSTKKEKREKSEFVTKFMGIIVTIIFISKSLSNSLYNLCHVVFFTDHLNHKTVNKTTGRTLLANPRQLCAQ